MFNEKILNQMKKIIILIVMTIAVLQLTSCKENEFEFGSIVAPSNIQITADIVGQDATNPNGDGSGVVNFTAEADNALSYKFIFNGSESTEISGKKTYTFSTLGVNTYTITVVAFGTGGASSSQTIQVDVLAVYEAPDDLKMKLFGFNPADPMAASSKTFRIKAEANTHFGLGPVDGTFFGEFFSAPANDKSGVGMYDDRFIFHSDGTFEHTTGGDIFGRSGLIDELASSGGSGGTADGADILNYSYNDYTESWSLIAPGGVETLELTGVGFIGYYIANHTYEIFDRQNPNELTLRITDGNNEFDWWFVITSADPQTGVTYEFNNLVWEDDFTVDGAPDTTKWTYDIGTGTNGWGNNEVQYYTDRPENVKVEGGNLIITAKRENYLGSAFTSARLKTEGLYDFKYGRVEVRAKLPADSGTWPAIWMLGANFSTVGWPQCGEIDIMEQTGADKNTILATCHWLDAVSSTKADFGLTTSITSATSEFHKYTLEWNDEFVTVYLDDVEYYRLANNTSLPFNENFFMILNVAMGGTLGGAIDSSFTENTMEIDYVRVFQ